MLLEVPLFRISLGKHCRMVCGRRVRVEHALRTGAKKQYNANDWSSSHRDRRYQSPVPYSYTLVLSMSLSLTFAGLCEKYSDMIA